MEIEFKGTKQKGLVKKIPDYVANSYCIYYYNGKCHAQIASGIYNIYDAVLMSKSLEMFDLLKTCMKYFEAQEAQDEEVQNLLLRRQIESLLKEATEDTF